MHHNVLKIIIYKRQNLNLIEHIHIEYLSFVPRLEDRITLFRVLNLSSNHCKMIKQQACGKIPELEQGLQVK